MKTIVPVGTAQVGCTVTLPTGALGAVGTAVLLVIVFAILDAITALGDLRNWLPGHYSQAWTDVLNPDIVWNEMAKGAASATILFALLITLSYLKFDRKDILS